MNIMKSSGFCTGHRYIFFEVGVLEYLNIVSMSFEPQGLKDKMYMVITLKIVLALR
jgi:hypothetical protein